MSTFTRENYPTAVRAENSPFYFINTQTGMRCFITGQVFQKTVEPVPENAEYVLLGANGGGSGKGLTYYAAAAADPRQAKINEEYQTSVKKGIKQPLPTINHFVLGSAFHRLLELWHFNQPVVLDCYELMFDVNVKEAYRLFCAYQVKFDRNHLGTPLAAEFKLPKTEEGIRKSKEMFFGMDIHGKPDQLVSISEQDVSRLERARGLVLPGPGLYLVDHKTSGYNREDSYYANGLQGILYPWLYELDHPNEKIIGTIYNIVITNQKKKDKTPEFQLVFNPYNEHKVKHLLGMIALAKLGLAFDLPNINHMTDKFTGQVQYFVANGLNDLTISPINMVRLAKVFEFINQLDKEFPGDHQK